MIVQIPVSRTLQKKLAALSQLEDIVDFESFLALQVECIVEDRITHFIGATTPRMAGKVERLPPPMHPMHPIMKPYRATKTETLPDDAELSHESYLDSDDDSDDDTPAASVGGLTFEQIAQDDQVADPEHEAVGVPGEYSFEDLAQEAAAAERERAPAPVAVEAQLRAIEAAQQVAVEPVAAPAAYVPTPMPPPSKSAPPRSVTRKPPAVRAKVTDMTQASEATRESF